MYTYANGNPVHFTDPTGTVWDFVDIGFFAQSLFNFIQQPGLDNAINLGLDGVGLLPGVPALGTLRQMGQAADKVMDVAKGITPNAQQAANINRFQKKIPSNSKESIELRELPNGGVAAQATSPGKVPGSKAVYEKQIDVNGKTVQATKTTYDPQGNIVHVKDKLNGGIYP